MSEDLTARSRALWNEHAKQHPGDLYAQVRRTINGRPVDDDQIALIVRAVEEALNLKRDDYLLDLCCGNGFLSDRFFALCKGGVGVDFSDVLVQTAREHFGENPSREFVCSDVLTFALEEPRPERFSKILCYGSLQYLPDELVARLLDALQRRFVRVTRFMIGNHVDREKLGEFFYERSYVQGIEDETVSALGRWRTESELRRLAEAAGWRVTFSRMPGEFYGARYRFDAVLSRR